ncbi:hypothetical protein FACS18949_13790 [Clostridia bacterium]|nr:hypothetical protein FACS18949_13790 [Clostridia bacterium]
MAYNTLSGGVKNYTIASEFLCTDILEFIPQVLVPIEATLLRPKS